MKKFLTVLILIISMGLMAFVPIQPHEHKAVCTAPVVPACFVQAVPGSNHCATHQNVPSTPTLKRCSYVGPWPWNPCSQMAVVGREFCAQHDLPDLNADKGSCLAPVIPVCFYPAIPGSSYCSTHQPPPAPARCAFCPASYPCCDLPVKQGSIYCGLHSSPPLAEDKTF